MILMEHQSRVDSDSLVILSIILVALSFIFFDTFTLNAKEIKYIIMCGILPGDFFGARKLLWYCPLQSKSGEVAGDDVESSDRKSSILILDDDFDIVTVIKLRLQQDWFFDVYAFTDPGLAFEHFKLIASKYQLVIPDIRIPQINGFVTWLGYKKSQRNKTSG